MPIVGAGEQYPFGAMFAMDLARQEAAKAVGAESGTEDDAYYPRPYGHDHTFDVWFRLSGRRRWSVLLVLGDDGSVSCWPDGRELNAEEDEPAPWKAALCDELRTACRRYPDLAPLENALTETLSKLRAA